MRDDEKEELWEKLASIFLIFIFGLALGYAWHWGQMEMNAKTDPDKVVVIRHCGEANAR